jgi:uncharacterized protein (DUF3084 family)
MNELAAVELERDEARTEMNRLSEECQSEREARLRAVAEVEKLRAYLASARHDQAHAEMRLGQAKARLAHATEQRNLALTGLAAAQLELQALRARDNDGQRTARLILEALGIDPDADQPLMAAREMRAELDELRDGRLWQVAAESVGVACASCTQPIVRGQAFQPLADAKGHLLHAICPNPKETP